MFRYNISSNVPTILRNESPSIDKTTHDVKLLILVLHRQGPKRHT